MSQTDIRLDRIDRKLGALGGIERDLERIVQKEDKELVKVEKQEAYIEKTMVKLGNYTIKRSHLMELARGTAGAFLGVGLGQALGLSVNLAKRLPWINIIGILLFVFLLVGLLIYKNDKTFIHEAKTSTFSYIISKVVVLYSISLTVLLMGLVLFNDFPGWNLLLVKALLVGSYPAMSSAAAFSLK
ncbi:MAG: hypothetical protein ABSD10_03285 [Candidatus Saccharimonadales bacterium]|jgi:hypothetical protein